MFLFKKKDLQILEKLYIIDKICFLRELGAPLFTEYFRRRITLKVCCPVPFCVYKRGVKKEKESIDGTD